MPFYMQLLYLTMLKYGEPLDSGNYSTANFLVVEFSNGLMFQLSVKEKQLYEEIMRYKIK